MTKWTIGQFVVISTRIVEIGICNVEEEKRNPPTDVCLNDLTYAWVESSWVGGQCEWRADDCTSNAYVNDQSTAVTAAEDLVEEKRLHTSDVEKGSTTVWMALNMYLSNNKVLGELHFFLLKCCH